MLTIIFGAGASYDSKPANLTIAPFTEPWQPPLTVDLFNSGKIWCTESDKHGLNFQYPLYQVVEQIRRQTKDQGLENALEQLRAERETNNIRWAQEIQIRIWINKVIRLCEQNWLSGLKNDTAYVDLVQRLDMWQRKSSAKINLISFNYDTLLEHAVSPYQNGSFIHFENYISGKFSVFKPHGSISWVHKIKYGDKRENLLDVPLNEWEKQNLVLLNNTNQANTIRLDERLRENVYATIPAIAIPVTNKHDDDFILPPNHKEKMIEAIKNTTLLLLIGWAGSEKHFLKLLSEYLRPKVHVGVICYEGGANTISNIHDSIVEASFEDSKIGFSTFLDRHNMLERFLENYKG